MKYKCYMYMYMRIVSTHSQLSDTQSSTSPKLTTTVESKDCRRYWLQYWLNLNRHDKRSISNNWNTQPLYIHLPVVKCMSDRYPPIPQLLCVHCKVISITFICYTYHWKAVTSPCGTASSTKTTLITTPIRVSNHLLKWARFFLL